MGIEKYTKGITKHTNKILRKPFFKEVPQDILNPLGRKATALTGAIALGGVAMWGYGAGKVTYQSEGLKQNAEYVGNLPSMAYDADPNVDMKTGKRDFGATGNLVFGLNNSRRG